MQGTSLAEWNVIADFRNDEHLDEDVYFYFENEVKQREAIKIIVEEITGKNLSDILVCKYVCASRLSFFFNYGRFKFHYVNLDRTGKRELFT